MVGEDVSIYNPWHCLFLGLVYLEPPMRHHMDFEYYKRVCGIGTDSQISGGITDDNSTAAAI